MMLYLAILSPSAEIMSSWVHYLKMIQGPTAERFIFFNGLLFWVKEDLLHVIEDKY